MHYDMLITLRFEVNVDISDLLGGCIAEASGARKMIDRESSDDAKIRFLQSQLAHIVADLLSMQVDLDSGMSLSDLGFESESDFCELLDMVSAQVRGLKAQIRALQEVGR